MKVVKQVLTVELDEEFFDRTTDMNPEEYLRELNRMGRKKYGEIWDKKEQLIRVIK